MKKSISISVAVLSLFCSNQLAMANRTENEAKTIAKKVLSDATHLTQEIKTNGGDTLYYTYKSATGGYAIVSAKEETPALLAYNKHQGLTAKEAAHIEEFLNAYYTNLPHLELKRQTDKNGLKASKLTGCAIAPLLETTWGQQEPYNQNSPTIGGVTAPTGCVATAIAQVLKYYQHPSAIQNDIPVYKTTTNGITIPSISKGTKIEWSKIQNKYEDGYTKENANAVANLVKTVGTAVRMDYKQTTSSAEASGVVELPLYFGYDADLIRRAFRSSFTLEEWYDLIYNELKEKRPVLISGSTMKDGHRFICDGIDDNGLFHINWGWDGSFNGYYDLTVLNPNTTTEVGASSSNDGYSKENSIVIGITPDNGKKDARTTTNVASVSIKHQVTNGNNYLFYNYANPYNTSQTIQLASGYINSKGEVELVSTAVTNNLDPASVYIQQNATPIQTNKMQEGSFYKVGLVESIDGKNWKPCEGFNNVSITFTVKNGKLVVASKHQLSAELEITDYNMVGSTSYGVINLKNDGDKEYYGVVYLMTNSVNDNPLKYSYAATVTVEADNDNQMEVMFLPKSDTTYYWIMDKDLTLLKEGFVVKGNKEYKLTGSAKIETLANGKIVCKVTLTNEGEALFQGNIDGTLLHNEGSTTNHKNNLVIKSGETIEYSIELKKDLIYTNYILTVGQNHFAVGKFDTKIEEGAINLYNNYMPYSGAGDDAKGFVTISNSYAMDITTNIKLTVSKTENGEQTEIKSEELFVKKNDLGIVDYETIAPSDSFYLHIYINGKEVMSDLFVPKATGVRLEKADNDIYIEVQEQTLLVTAQANTNLTIVGANGVMLTRTPLVSGETFRKELKPGIYMVNRKKIIIK